MDPSWVVYGGDGKKSERHGFVFDAIVEIVN
jgi:hypothetical protein